MTKLRIVSFIPATEVRIYLSDRSYGGGYSGGRRVAVEDMEIEIDQDVFVIHQ